MRYWSDATFVPGQQYEYDTIGNRTSTKAGEDSAGANLRAATYTPNLLNTSRHYAWDGRQTEELSE